MTTLDFLGLNFNGHFCFPFVVNIKSDQKYKVSIRARQIKIPFEGSGA